MPATNEYVLDEGYDPTTLWGGYASTLLQMVRNAKPNDYRGMTIWTANDDVGNRPLVTGQPTGYPTNWYEWQKRCLWLSGANGKVYSYRTGLGWENVANKIDNGIIVNSMIAAGTINVNKIDITTGGGAALRVLRINAANTALEFVAPANLYTAGTIPIDRLVPGGLGNKYFMQSDNGVLSWTLFDSATVLSLFSANEIPVNFLAHGAADRVLAMNAGGTGVEWATAVSKIPTAGLDIAKISPGAGNASKTLKVNSGGTALEYVTVTIPTTPNVQRTTAEIGTLPAASSNATSAHGLSAIPDAVHGYLECVTNEAGYVTGDLVDLGAVTGDDGAGDYDFSNVLTFSWDATNVTLTRGPETTLDIMHKTTGARTTFTPANWKFQYTAIRYY